MKALSIKQPFATLIMNGLKDREHRTWKTDFRGKFIVHSSKIPDIKFMKQYGFNKTALSNGVLLGTIELYDVELYENGIKAFLLRNPMEFNKSIPYIGQLGFFEIDKSILLKYKNGR